MSPTPAVKTTTLTVHVNTDNGTLNVVQSPKPGNEGEFVCELSVTGTSAASVKAYMSFLDQSDLKPDAGTVADSFQNLVFPFQDTNMNALSPTFNTQTSHGSVNVVFTAFTEGAYLNQPMESVVIVDW